jgi:peptide subunit release factor 1 (eRF1)/intein/homing endonuclease
MDLTIGSASHNFFANGFLVHNCDDHFHIEPLRDMLREENVIGVLSMDSTEAGLGIVSGDSWEVVDTMSSGVSGKTRKGGQCVSSDSFVQLDDGSLVEISKVGRHSRIASYNFVSNSLGYYHCADVFSVVPEDYYEIFTNHPNLNIRTTSEHRFFAPGPNGIVTKHAFELKEGDALLVPARLPEVGQPDLRTRFPSEINHNIDLQGQRLLRQLRTRAKISQRTLAGRAGLTQADISRLEHGEQNPGWDKLQRLISLLVADTEEFVASHVTSNAGLPEFFSKELLQLMGYISGNGILGKDVILLSESDYDVSYLYSNLINKSLGIRALPVISRIDRRRHVKSSGATYETRIQSPSFRDAIKKYYPQIVSNMKREIPEQIHHLDNYHLKYFLRGLFDAKGKISGPVLCVNARSSALIRQVQLLLLRFGIRSSQAERGTCKNVVFHLHIDDTKSILVFNREIGFSEQKRMVLEQDPKRENTSCIECRTHGQGSYQTHRDHRQNKQLSKTFKGPGGSFSSAPRNPGDVLRENWQTGRMRESGGGLLMEDVFATATTSMSKDLVLAKVARIKISKNVKHVKFVDVELPETMSFIGNGFVLHNSARRYERLREMELTDYFNRLADHSKKAFLEQYQIKGLIVSGPGPTKDEFVRDKYLDYRLQNMIVGTLDSGYSGREGVRETIEKAGKLLENVRVIEEKKLVQRFFREVNSDSGLAIYGVRDILAALKKAAVDTIIINDDVDMVYLKAVCNKCGNVTEKFVTRAQIVNEKQSLLVCPKCGSNEIQIAEKDIVDYLADAAIDSGADVEVISSKTEDGSMLKNFGGISAILRYRI